MRAPIDPSGTLLAWDAAPYTAAYNTTHTYHAYMDHSSTHAVRVNLNKKILPSELIYREWNRLHYLSATNI